MKLSNEEMQIMQMPNLKALRDYLNTLAEEPLSRSFFYKEGDDVTRIMNLEAHSVTMYRDNSDDEAYCYTASQMEAMNIPKERWVEDYGTLDIVLTPSPSVLP